MSKGIIVVDMPDKCSQCPLGIKDMRFKTGLCAVRECLYDDMKFLPLEYEKPDWCPIKEIPEKKEVQGVPRKPTMGDFMRSGFQKGWNACVDEILKGGDGI